MKSSTTEEYDNRNVIIQIANLKDAVEDSGSETAAEAKRIAQEAMAEATAVGAQVEALEPQITQAVVDSADAVDKATAAKAQADGIAPTVKFTEASRLLEVTVNGKTSSATISGGSGGGGTGTVSINQGPEGISINDIALQDATEAQDGLMTKELVVKVNTAGDATATANEAKTLATQAKATADAVDGKAGEAKQLALEAKADAATASSAADEAKRTATAAQTTANGVDAKATAAQKDAASATKTAGDAKTIAQGVDAKATEAKSTADDALRKANSAESAVADKATTASVNAVSTRVTTLEDQMPGKASKTYVDNAVSGYATTSALNGVKSTAEAAQQKANGIGITMSISGNRITSTVNGDSDYVDIDLPIIPEHVMHSTPVHDGRHNVSETMSWIMNNCRIGDLVNIGSFGNGSNALFLDLVVIWTAYSGFYLKPLGTLWKPEGYTHLVPVEDICLNHDGTTVITTLTDDMTSVTQITFGSDYEFGDLQALSSY